MCSQGGAPTGGMPLWGGSHGGIRVPTGLGGDPKPPLAPPRPARSLPSLPPRSGRGRAEPERSRSGSEAEQKAKRSISGAGSMAPAGRLCAVLLCGALSLCSLRAAGRQPDTLYLWIEAQQARVLIGKPGSPARPGCRGGVPAAALHRSLPPLPFAGFEEDILIVSEGKMAPFTHDFRKAQQRMPAIPVNIHAMNFTWQATGRVGAEPGRGARQVLLFPLGKPLRGSPLLPIAPHCTPLLPKPSCGQAAPARG